MPSLWNSLLQDIVMAISVSAFKKEWGKFVEGKSTNGYATLHNGYVL